MEISREELKLVVTPLHGFTMDSINSNGSVTLPLSVSLMLSPGLHCQPHVLDEIPNQSWCGICEGQPTKS
ncbi:unnamed protein product [Prunus armeniaca]